MLFEDLGESARTLLTGRGRVLSDGLSRLAREYANHSSHELAEALQKVPRDQKAGLGLLLARVALEEAVTTRSRELFSRFLYRFGSHLKLSVSEPGLTPSQRLALATASETIFDALPTASSKQRAEVSSIRNRLSGPTTTSDDWTSTLGVSEREFTAIIGQFGRELGERRRSGHREKSKDQKRTVRQTIRPVVPRHPLPPWLAVTFNGAPDPLVGATANWHPGEVQPEEPFSLELAWSAFREGNYPAARAALDELLAKIGEDWGPSSGADALRSWNWVRLVTELAALDSSEVNDARRSWTSACGFAYKCLPDDSELIDRLLENAIGDFVASDLASTRAWSAYSTRLVADLGHEAALALYSNQDKASLRAVWRERFALNPVDVRSTASAAASVAPRFQQVTRKLYLGAREAIAPSRVLREASHDFAELLDEAEGVLLIDALDLVQEAERIANQEGSTHRDLREVANELQRFKYALAGSGSGLLQDFLAPLAEVAIGIVRDATSMLGNISRPDVSVRLSSAKVPFSAASGSSYEIRFVATNTGNTPAESISLRVVEKTLGIDSIARLNSLGPGAQTELSLDAVATGTSSRAVTLVCELQWTDALLQQFSSRAELSAEDQMPVAWADGDVNPFSLGTISEPGRLVGRADDLASLDALLAGNASAYVTGHKRVGKTSLTRVLLRSVEERRGWATSLLPLGRALGHDQTAGDLVYALLDEILEATRDAYGAEVSGVVEVVSADVGNFARVANKWLRTVARVLPPGARVVIAVDDFDELPTHLIEGPQADALFLFLRSLVDEPWLNLIVVGSEILPTIIQAQAHKLNQVVPVSVTNFSSRNATDELLETPTSDRLEWVTDAIDRVHYLCSGNPYYETLLAQRLWQQMRELSRSVVTASDVDAAALSIARDASDSHFIHLWADGATGLDHTARPAIVASAVLRSIARAGGQHLDPASPDEVTRLAQGWIQTATTNELHQSIAGLKVREVVKTSPSASRLLLSIPLVGIWLQEAGGRALDGVYANSKHATATVRMITDADLVELSKGLRYRGEQVTEIRIKAWLEQFGGNDTQYLAYKMLRRMILDGYFDSHRLQTVEVPRLIKAAAQLGAHRLLLREANNQYMRNAYLVNHGVAGDSTQGTLSLLAKALRIKKANIIKVGDIAERVRATNSEIVFYLLDDYCGTGTHLAKELDSLVDSITKLGEDWVDRSSIVVGASVVADEADLPTQDGRITIETLGGTYLGDRYRPFADTSGVFDTAKEREDAKQMTLSIGRALVPNNPLGFGGRALLTLFEFNCPNNVAPIFWKSGTVAGETWTPLFERAV